MTHLTEDQIKAELSRLPGWDRTGDQISKSYKFKSFIEAMKFVNRLAEEAEREEHHPDILIAYDTVTVTLSTFDEGGKLTDYDFTSAKTADRLFQEFDQGGPSGG